MIFKTVQTLNLFVFHPSASAGKVISDHTSVPDNFPRPFNPLSSIRKQQPATLAPASSTRVQAAFAVPEDQMD